MKGLIGAARAADILLVLLVALALFHVLILLGVLPSGIVWGGRAEGAAGGFRAMEAVSLAITGIMAFVVAARAGHLGSPRLGKAVRAALWVMFVYFLLNIAGNLASRSGVERAVFTPFSVILALLVLRVASERK
ncbi:MAG: hypothetical protein JW958_01585 [Candidatus Eisenbacteria bacterium]|nr:hypothetical protein [Candidatus Eisenbacteria bacterium]